MSPLSCLSGVALPVQVVRVPPPWSLGGGLWVLGWQEGSPWLRELAGDAGLAAATAARDRGGWACPRLATPMCHSLQGSQWDGLTRTL